MKGITLQEKEFIVPLFDYRIQVVITESFEEWLVNNDFDASEAVELNAACVYYDDRPEAILLFSSTYEITIAAISHECTHAAIELMKFKGIPVNYENQEVLCYVQDYIIDQVLAP